MKRNNEVLDKTLKLDEYKGKLESYTIRAIRNYRAKETVKVNEWSLNYYKRNKEDINKRHGRHLAIKRIKDGKNVQQKTLDKYEITEKELEEIKQQMIL